MDCTTAAAWVSVAGGSIELLGIVTVAVDLFRTGRVPNLKASVQKLLRRRPSVVYGQASSGSGLSAHGMTQTQGITHIDLESDTDDVAGHLRRLERRIEEMRADLQREAAARAEAIARLERSIHKQLQSLQNEITGLRRDFNQDKADEISRPWIAWTGITAFVVGLALSTLGSFMSAQCT